MDDLRPQMPHSPDDRHLIETPLRSEQVFAGKLLHVRRDAVRLPDGGEATREYIVHPGAVLIAPLLPDGRLVVERQFRYPLNRVFLEFPAGKREAAEDPLVTAQRELAEEAGYAAARWTHLGTVHTVVSYSTEAIEFYLAEGLTHVGAQLDHGEFLEVGEMALDEMLARLDRGEITDVKTVAMLLMLDRRFRGR